MSFQKPHLRAISPKKACGGALLADANFVVPPTFWASPFVSRLVFISVKAPIRLALNKTYS